jgi:hypothetical protein
MVMDDSAVWTPRLSVRAPHFGKRTLHSSFARPALPVISAAQGRYPPLKQNRPASCVTEVPGWTSVSAIDVTIGAAGGCRPAVTARSSCTEDDQSSTLVIGWQSSQNLEKVSSAVACQRKREEQ